METSFDTQPTSRKREDNLSKDGQWRSFPKVPHLLQYVSNDNYYGRIKVGGKIIRESLKTDVWTTAKLRLVDFLKMQRENRNRVDPPKFSEAVEWFKHGRFRFGGGSRFGLAIEGGFSDFCISGGCGWPDIFSASFLNAASSLRF